MSQSLRVWWKEAVVYQIYPRSFCDSNGGGVGDLKGILSKVPYIASLGVDVVWLTPIFESPNDDMGYDISNYQKIAPDFGTMSDFEMLLQAFHDVGIKVILDLVVNHTSDEHFWFQEASKSRDNPYRDFYHWWPEEKGTPPKRQSFFDAKGDAWRYHAPTKSYYLHYFSKKQPDLNWENKELRENIYAMMRFWFDKGVDGFRMDVITYIAKDTSFPEAPAGCDGSEWEAFYSMGPQLHDYLSEMNQQALSHYDIMTVAEGPGMNAETILDLVGEERQELNMAYHFDHVNMGLKPRKLLSEKVRDLVEFKKINSKWDRAIGDKGWMGAFLGNHDQPRMVTRWGCDSEQFREKSSKLLNTYILTTRATPYCYMGDELGMTNPKFEDISEYRDIETINWYRLTANEGGDVNEFLESHKITARDNGRVPFHWDDSPNAGFTSGDPWIKVNQNYSEINQKAQEDDATSCLNYFRDLVEFRKQNPVLVYGEFETLLPDHPQIYAYTRVLEGVFFLVLLNFSGDLVESEFDQSFANSTVLKNNGLTDPLANKGRVACEPWQASIHQIDLPC